MSGVYSQYYTEKIVANKARNDLIVGLVRECHNQGKYVIVLVRRVAHLKLLSDRLKSIPHKVVSGTFKGKQVKVADRMESKQAFEAGDIRLIIANVVFTKGVNMRRVDVIIDAAAGRNEDDPVQKFGRGIRKHEDKSGLLYFDINDWDSENPKNWFHVASRYRTRALQRAGVEVHKLIWDISLTPNDLLVKAEQWLNLKLEH